MSLHHSLRSIGSVLRVFLCTVIWPKHVLQKFAATTFSGNLVATPRVDLQDLASEKLVINTHLNTHSFMRLREKHTCW
jgi:hypothetical protein